MKEMAAVVLVVFGLTLLWFSGVVPEARAQAVASSYTATADTGRILYEGGNNVEAWGRCQIYTRGDPARSCTWEKRYVANGVPGVDRMKIFNAAKNGVWTWQAPTRLENGDILTDLAHYLIYREAAPAAPTIWAQVSAEVTRAIFPMAPADFGACFYVVAVRKPATSAPVASDRSNRICMDGRGQPLPAT